MKTFEIQATKNLGEHDKVLQAVLTYFHEIPGVVGCFLSGSMATNRMTQDSDLDIGIVMQSANQREQIWQKRWDWKITPWFHRFDADHIKPYFVIYCFEPHIRADINLYIESDLPPIEGGPYLVIWDHDKILNCWIEALSNHAKPAPNWEDVVHEDERFWAWSFYVYAYLHRGDYYHIAVEFPALREIIEKWSSRLDGHAKFTTRDYINESFAVHLLNDDLFPKPNLASLKNAMLVCIELQLNLRKEIYQKIGVQWKTSDHAIQKITGLIEEL
jgi:hypothetical protein